MLSILFAAVQFVTINPGHLNAALVQSRMYESVSADVLVYAPGGDELKSHLSLIRQFNTRTENPTAWREGVYAGADFLKRFEKDAAIRPAAENAEKIVILAGRNNVKPDYYLAGVEAGLNVLSDMPMAITPDDYMKLCDAAAVAKDRGLLFWDIATERHEMTSILQRELSRVVGVYGMQESGTLDDPAVAKVSVRHFCRFADGKPLRRPGWYYDTKQQGEAIVDATAHLVDIVQWSLFPNQSLKRSDVKMLAARIWNTPISAEDYRKSTGLKVWPAFLKKSVDGDNVLQCRANGEFTYTLRGVHAKVSVVRNFSAPEGTGDTHCSYMRGSNAELVIRQGSKQGFRPVLYVKLREGADRGKTESALNAALAKIGERYPGIAAVSPGGEEDGAAWKIHVPEKYDIGHEARISQAVRQFLGWMKEGKMPEMERRNLLVKYYTLVQAWRMSRR